MDLNFDPDKHDANIEARKEADIKKAKDTRLAAVMKDCGQYFKAFRKSSERAIRKEKRVDELISQINKLKEAIERRCDGCPEADSWHGATQLMLDDLLERARRGLLTTDMSDPLGLYKPEEPKPELKSLSPRQRRRTTKRGRAATRLKGGSLGGGGRLK